MEENIYMLPDGEICRKIGEKVKELRLHQNITQASLANLSQISVSSIKKIENGDIGTFDSLIRVLRVLGELEIFSPLMKEEEMSPNEYWAYIQSAKKKRRKRASSETNMGNSNNGEKSEW